MEKKYAFQKPLRRVAELALRGRGYEVSPLSGSGGARVWLKKDGEEMLAMVRTSADRHVGWMRNDQGEWKGMLDADIVVVAALAANGIAEIYGFEPEAVHEAFTLRLAARDEHNPDIKVTAPLFVCLDEKEGVESSNLKSKALWSVEMPLDPAADDQVSLTSSRENDMDAFTARVRREFAELVRKPLDKVRVEFFVSV